PRVRVRAKRAEAVPARAQPARVRALRVLGPPARRACARTRGGRAFDARTLGERGLVAGQARRLGLVHAARPLAPRAPARDAGPAPRRRPRARESAHSRDRPGDDLPAEAGPRSE